MSQRTQLGLLAAASIACSITAVRAAESRALEFKREIQNVPAVSRPLSEEPYAKATNDCPELAGTLRYGAIPHRLADEPMTESEHFVSFAAAYGDGLPALIVDIDQDGVLACDERVDTVPHPAGAEIVFRTLVLQWDDGGPARQQRYRLKLPARLGEAARYEVERVDVPVGRWTEGGHTTLWMLYDGNYDGLFGGKFGDGVLIDTEGTGRFDLSVKGPQFHSFLEPIRLPWGTFRVTEVTTTGERLALEAVADSAAEPHYAAGDTVPAMSCQALEGEAIAFGGATDRHQVLFFWVSNCADCWDHARQLSELAARIGPERLAIVGISMDENPEKSSEFVRLTAADWRHCFSGRVLWDNALARQFDVDRPSDFVVIAPSGALVVKSGDLSVIEELVRAAAPAFSESSANGS